MFVIEREGPVLAEDDFQNRVPTTTPTTMRTRTAASTAICFLERKSQSDRKVSRHFRWLFGLFFGFFSSKPEEAANFDVSSSKIELKEPATGPVCAIYIGFINIISLLLFEPI